MDRIGRISELCVRPIIRPDILRNIRLDTRYTIYCRILNIRKPDIEQKMHIIYDKDQFLHAEPNLHWFLKTPIPE